jgi:hypothetical protein
MAEGAKSRTTSASAVIALCISIVTAAFSFYQWWTAEDESRIAAAIEISRNYFSEAHQQPIRAIVAAALDKIDDSNVAASALMATNYLEYVAFLANSKRIDARYLSQDIKCDMNFAREGTRNITKRYHYLATGAVFPQIDKFLLAGVACPPISVNPDKS